jgi:homoserine kinase
MINETKFNQAILKLAKDSGVYETIVADSTNPEAMWGEVEFLVELALSDAIEHATSGLGASGSAVVGTALRRKYHLDD